MALALLAGHFHLSHDYPDSVSHVDQTTFVTNRRDRWVPSASVAASLSGNLQACWGSKTLLASHGQLLLCTAAAFVALQGTTTATAAGTHDLSRVSQALLINMSCLSCLLLVQCSGFLALRCTAQPH